MNKTRRLLSVFGVRPARIGGTEVFARRLSERLGELGWESVVCFASQPAGEVRRFLSLPNVTFEFMEDAWKFHWRPALELQRILARTRPEILHLHFTGFLSPYPWIARLNGVRRVYFTAHGSPAEDYVATRKPWWKRTAARALNLHLDRVICNSDFNTACVKAHGVIDPARVQRIYNGVDCSAQHGDGRCFRQRFGIPQDALVVLQVSRIAPDKGIDDFLAAAEIILKQEPRAHFVIAGEGQDRPRYMEQARRAGMEDRFTWTGTILNPIPGGLFAAADVVCLLSRWQESFGWVIAEAMTGVRPVVGTKVGGIPELVRDGETGFVVPKRSPERVAERVLELLRDPALRDRMGRAGQALAKRKFDLEERMDELLSVYGLLAGRRWDRNFVGVARETSNFL